MVQCLELPIRPLFPASHLYSDHRSTHIMTCCSRQRSLGPFSKRDFKKVCARSFDLPLYARMALRIPRVFLSAVLNIFILFHNETDER